MPGTAFGFVPTSIAGLAGVAQQEAGPASGLLNASQQLGRAIGIAIASTVAATHLKPLLGEGQTPSAALTGGFHWAWRVCGTVALLALPTTAILAGRTTPRPGWKAAALAFEAEKAAGQVREVSR